MNDPNYNDYFDFYGEDDKYLEKNDIIDPFEQLVYDYLESEWMVDIDDELQQKTKKFIAEMKNNNQSVPNTAARIVFEIIYSE